LKEAAKFGALPRFVTQRFPINVEDFVRSMGILFVTVHYSIHHWLIVVCIIYFLDHGPWPFI